MARYIFRRPIHLNVKPERRAVPVVHIDVTAIALGDRRAGIQRVVRQVSRAWFANADRKLGINFVRVDERGKIIDAWDWARKTLSHFVPEVQKGAGMLRAGDMYFSLDLALPPHGLTGQSIKALKQSGVCVAHLVYDLLPITHAKFFNLATRLAFRLWLSRVERSDVIFTISEAAKADLVHHFKASRRHRNLATKIFVIPLSGELELVEPTSPQFARTEVGKEPAPLFLAIGTVEPRKGYRELLRAFTDLWREGLSVSLWVFGRPGWKTRALQKAMLRHPQRGRQFMWFPEATDKEVRDALEQADALIMNSYAEGLGLPILEAQRSELPVIARDLGVFRETIGPSDVLVPAPHSSESLASTVRRFVHETRGSYRRSESFASTASWSDTAQTLERVLINQRG
jgi:glycosyltransferase involved in cell wall biosynthesis